ncbi:PREDICTED: trypsin epsilon-like, partial [Wasmannia auropunctata]|uniref:trypsin epsilon-like n=1 Tax=Wasmannia auropunctata TaxID=64793 RepID=UPI0005F09E84
MTLRILCLFSFLAFSHARVFPFFDPRIVGGEDAKVGEFPYQVSLQDKDSGYHYCGGAILTDKYVITTALCVGIEGAKGIKVVAGTINLTNPKSEHNVVKAIRHEGFNPNNSWINDIALLKVDPPFIMSATVGHVPRPPTDHVVKPNDVAVVSGWGSLWDGGPRTTKLQRVNILIADQDYCRYMYKNIGYNVHPTQVCAFDPSAEKGS